MHRLGTTTPLLLPAAAALAFCAGWLAARYTTALRSRTAEMADPTAVWASLDPETADAVRRIHRRLTAGQTS